MILKIFPGIIYRSKLLTSSFFIIAISKVCNFGLKSELPEIFVSKCKNKHCKTFLVKNGFLETIYFFVVLRQNKVKGLPSSQSPRLNPKLIYAMKLQLKINFKM